MSYLDVLVPPNAPRADLIGRLRDLRLTDSGEPVDLGPLDEASLNLVRRALTATTKDVCLELPAGRSDFAVLLGVYLQLMRRGAALRRSSGAENFGGPVVVIGRNTNLTERLRRIKIGAETLSEALRAQRVRADGTVTDLRGVRSPAAAWGDGLLYLNTSLGWPTLAGVRAGIVVIDRTSFRNPETLDLALTWAAQHLAGRIVVLTAAGGDALPADLANQHNWVRWGWTPGLRRDVAAELGRREACGPLTTNALVKVTPRPIALAEYIAPELTRLRRSCLRGIAVARRVGAPLPRALADTVHLVNACGQLWGRPSVANEFAVASPRGLSTATLRRSLAQIRESDLSGPWAGFRETDWPDLRRAAVALIDLLDAYNPRYDLLWGLLDWAFVNRPGTSIAIRAGSRTAAAALEHELLGDRPQMAARFGEEYAGRVSLRVLPYSAQLPWAESPSLEIHLGVPPPWRRTVLCSGEASEHLFAVDADEARYLRTVLGVADREWSATLALAADTLRLDEPRHAHLGEPRTVYGPVRIDDRGQDSEQPNAGPALVGPELFAVFTDVLVNLHAEPRCEDTRDMPTSRSVCARRIVLEPGDTEYWLPADASVEVLVGGRYGTLRAVDLSAGHSLLIARGDTRSELYERLLEAAHSDADVMAVTMLLRRFRGTVHRLHQEFGSWDEVARQLASRGSDVTTGQTCRNWALGIVIAPDDPNDIRRVAWLAKEDRLILDRTWERIGALAGELRTLNRALGRLLSAAIGEAASGTSGQNLRRLAELCGGIDPAEILEEFAVRQIRSVGPPEVIQASKLRRIAAIQTRRSA